MGSSRGPITTREFQLFVRDARRAAHQALYFLYMLEDSTSADEAVRTGLVPAVGPPLRPDSAEFGADQVRTIVDAVHIPAAICESRDRISWTARLSLADWRDRVKDRHLSSLQRGRYLRALSWRLLWWLLAVAASRRAPQVLRRWLGRILDLTFERDGSPAKLFALHEDLHRRASSGSLVRELLDLDGEGPESGSSTDHEAEVNVIRFWARQVWEVTQRDRREWLADGSQCQHLIWQLQAFLRITRPRGLKYITHVAARCVRFVLRNLAAALGLLLVMAIFALDPICSLVRNGGIWGYIAALVPLILGSFVIRLLPGNRKAFFRLAFPVDYPDHGIELWQATCSVRRSAEKREVINAGLLAMVWIAVAAGFAAVRPEQPTLQTIVFIVGCLAMSVTALHWIDTWEFLDARPIRALFLCGAVVAGGVGLWVEEERFAVLIPSAAVVLLSSTLAARRIWRRNRGQSDTRVFSVFGITGTVAAGILALWATVAHLKEESWQGEGPFQAIAAADWPASGVDSKGARNAEMPVVLVAASGGGSRAAIYTALTLERLHRDLPEVAANIQAISSVSGGSLGTAAYLRARLDGKLCLPGQQHACGPGVTDTDLGVVAARVSGDFLRPTLTGALFPWSSRAAAIERSWATDVQLGDLRLSDLVNAWRSRRDQGNAPLPIPLFNSASLDGHAVVISPLSAMAYSPRATPGQPLPCMGDPTREKMLRKLYGLDDKDILTWVLDRDAVYGLEQIDNRLDPRLTSAVRASANFPFGFPLVRVELSGQCNGTLPDGSKTVALTDGGVLSNSGLWSLFHLLTGGQSGMHDVGALEQRLRQRGVLLLVIDASHMPLYAAKSIAASRLYGAIRDQAPVAQNLHRKMFEMLKYRYQDSLRVVQIDLVPRIDDNVYTTWALDPASREKLVASFRRVWGDGGQLNARQAIACAWSRLKSGRDGNKDSAECPDQPGRLLAGQMPEGSHILRPPLD